MKRPRALPAASVANASGSPARSISRAMDASVVIFGFMSVARRRQISSRGAIGHVTESIPSRLTPRRMNGTTVVWSSVPPVSPELAMLAP